MALRLLIAVLRFIGSRRSKGEMRHSDVRSLLIVELSRLGDVVSMLGTVKALGRHLPQATIHLLIDQRYASLVQNLQVDVHVHSVVDSRSVSGLVQAISLARRAKADLGISISPSKRNAISVLASRAKYKAGYLGHIDSVTPFLLQTKMDSFGFSLATPQYYGRENLYERAEKVCRALGVATGGCSETCELHPEIVAGISTKLQRGGSLPDKPYVVIHPFSGWDYRSWELSRYRLLAERVVQEIGHGVVFLYSPEDAVRMENVVGHFKENEDLRFLSSPDLLEAAVVLQGAALFVGNDSGPLHLAAALGVRVVGLYGPATPDLTGPLNAKGRFLYKRVECSPCAQRTCVKPENPCMSLISVDEVYSAVAGILNDVHTDVTSAHA